MLKLMLPTLGLYALAFLAPAALAADAAKAVVWPAGEIAWTDNAAVKGAKTAVLWGDPTKGAYGALRKLPAGAALALHTHPADHRVVMVAGTIALSIEGQPAKDLGPGSFALIPAGAKHKADCKAGPDCVYFEDSPAKYEIDFAK